MNTSSPAEDYLWFMKTKHLRHMVNYRPKYFDKAYTDSLTTCCSALCEINNDYTKRPTELPLPGKDNCQALGTDNSKAFCHQFRSTLAIDASEGKTRITDLSTYTKSNRTSSGASYFLTDLESTQPRTEAQDIPSQFRNLKTSTNGVVVPFESSLPGNSRDHTKSPIKSLVKNPQIRAEVLSTRGNSLSKGKLKSPTLEENLQPPATSMELTEKDRFQPPWGNKDDGADWRRALVPASVFLYQVAQMELSALRKQEEELLQRRRILELCKLREPLPKWYTFRGREFSSEAARLNCLIQWKAEGIDVEARRKDIFRQCFRYANDKSFVPSSGEA